MSPSIRQPFLEPRRDIGVTLARDIRAATVDSMVGMLFSRTGRAFSKRARERSRVAAHIARAERFASESAAALDPLRALVRDVLLRALREYREEGIFPENHRTGWHSPVFVDEQGTRCAVGHLLELSGESERNLATVHQLADEPRLVQWLEAAGISLTEASLIQPGYAPTCSTAAQCFCAPYRIRGAPQSRYEGDGGVQTTAVLDCTLIETNTARRQPRRSPRGSAAIARPRSSPSIAAATNDGAIGLAASRTRRARGPRRAHRSRSCSRSSARWSYGAHDARRAHARSLSRLRRARSRRARRASRRSDPFDPPPAAWWMR